MVDRSRDLSCSAGEPDSEGASESEARKDVFPPPQDLLARPTRLDDPSMIHQLSC